MLAWDNRTVAYPKPNSINRPPTLGRAHNQLKVPSLSVGLISDYADTDDFSMRGSKHGCRIALSTGLKTMQIIKQFRSDQRNINISIKLNNGDKVIRSQPLTSNRLKLVGKGLY